MKPTTSSTATKRLFTTILFAVSTVLLAATLGGCSGAPDSGEQAETTTDRLDDKPLEVKKVKFDPTLPTDLAQTPGNSGSDIDGVTDGITPPRQKQNLE
jgi:hypothetical protein